MPVLKQCLKQILIHKQHKRYADEIVRKQVTYDKWIRIQEEKLEIDSVAVRKLPNSQAIAVEKDGKACEKNENAGYPSELVEKCQIWEVFDKQKEKGERMRFLLLSKNCREAEIIQIITKNKTDVILFCGEEGRLADIALPLLYREFSEKENIVLIYGDEDVQIEGKRENPWFKPEWSPDTFLSCFYFGGLTAIRANAAAKLLQKGQGQWENTLKDKSFVYQLCYQMIKEHHGFGMKMGGEPVAHIPEVLFHWSHWDEKNMERRDRNGKDQPDDQEGRKKEKSSLVSIIIPSKDNPQVLFQCIDSVLEKTRTVIPFEIILVDNGSREENRQWIMKEVEGRNLAGKNINSMFLGCMYIYHPMDFNFSVMCNIGAKQAKGDLLLFLNDDMEVIGQDWLMELAVKARLPYTGAVGAKLLYPDSDIIQHAGITNLRVGPAHKLQFLPDHISHYFGKNRGDHNVMAVTGACLMVRKEVFWQVGGFPEELAVAFNDVDLCYSIYEAGYYNTVRNDVVLYHHESLSRGKDGESEEKQQRMLREKDLLYERHPALYGEDPFYHKYLASDLLESEYTPAFRCQVTLDMPWASPKEAGRILEKAREDQCLVIGMECAIDLYKWLYGVTAKKRRIKEKPEEKGYYFQGYSFVIGADNACYKKTLLLQNKNTGTTWMIPVDIRYRKDIKDNLKDQLNVDLTGFAAKIKKHELEQGTYRFGILAEDQCSRQKLVNWSNWVLEV